MGMMPPRPSAGAMIPPPSMMQGMRPGMPMPYPYAMPHMMSGLCEYFESMFNHTHIL